MTLERVKTILGHIIFDRAINVGILLLVLSCTVTFVQSMVGVEIWKNSDLAVGSEAPERIDLFFATLYTAIAVLYAQNLLHFYQTRERLYLTYCLYITFLGLHVILYGQVLNILGVSVPTRWAAHASLAAHNISMIYMFRFARLLLQSEQSEPRVDQLLKAGMVLTLFPLTVAYLAGDTAFYIYDTFLTSTIGAVVLFGSARLARGGNKAALIFFLSYLAQYVGFLWSYIVFVFPDMAATINPLYAESPFLAESSIWISALALEALFMSFAAHIYLRGLRSKADLAEDKAGQLDRALRKAKAHLAVSAQRVAPDRLGGEAQAQPENLSAALREIIQANAGEPFVDVAFLANATATSKATLLRRLKQETGLSPSVFIRQVRLDLAHELLASDRVRTVGEAMTETGFSSMGHFAKTYRSAFGEAPAETLKGPERKG